MNIENIIQDNIDYLIKIRRYFHENPELSGEEKNTYTKITNELKKFNINYKKVGDYGVIGFLEGSKAGKTILLRADIDALPIEESENNLCSKKKSVSKIKGISHMCGHDGHTAIMLTAAKVLSEIKNNIKGRVIFCFESGEEKGTGIEDMINSLKNEKVDGVWGIHIYFDIESGKISVEEGPVMAGNIKFNVKVNGKGGHGAMPEEAIDPINCAAQILNSLNTINSRIISSKENFTLTVGQIHGGDADNIIPESIWFSGTIRYYEEEIKDKIVDSFSNIVKGISSANNCISQIDWSGSNSPVVNNKEVSLFAKESIEKSLGKQYLCSHSPWLASDSMSEYLKKYKGVYAFLGTKNPTLGTGACHHNPLFDIDEKALENGLIATINFALDFLK